MSDHFKESIHRSVDDFVDSVKKDSGEIAEHEKTMLRRSWTDL